MPEEAIAVAGKVLDQLKTLPSPPIHDIEKLAAMA
jgi:hypothetical protein